MKIVSFCALALFIIAGAFFLYPEYARGRSSLLILNSDTRGKLPEKFHMTEQFSSGSSQFSEDALRRMLQVIPSKKVIIVDLREEPHGFLNGEAIGWYRYPNWLNEGKTLEEIITDEKARLLELSKQSITVLYAKKSNIPLLKLVKSAETEEEIVKKYEALAYLRLPVRDHTRPSDEIADAFVTFVKGLDGGEWLHFHCSKGHGRTTTFLSMYDMMRNASTTPVEEIISRQATYGGIHLFNKPQETDWKIPYNQERIAFLKKFHQYCKENPNFNTPWSEWIVEN